MIMIIIGAVAGKAIKGQLLLFQKWAVGKLSESFILVGKFSSKYAKIVDKKHQLGRIF